LKELVESDKIYLGGIMTYFIIVALFIIVGSVRQINAYEKGILFAFGKYKKS